MLAQTNTALALSVATALTLTIALSACGGDSQQAATVQVETAPVDEPAQPTELQNELPEDSDGRGRRQDSEDGARRNRRHDRSTDGAGERSTEADSATERSEVDQTGTDHDPAPEPDGGAGDTGGADQAAGQPPAPQAPTSPDDNESTPPASGAQAPAGGDDNL